MLGILPWQVLMQYKFHTLWPKRRGNRSPNIHFILFDLKIHSLDLKFLVDSLKSLIPYLVWIEFSTTTNNECEGETILFFECQITRHP